MALTQSSSNPEIAKAVQSLISDTNSGNLHWVGSAYPYRGSLPETVPCYFSRRGNVHLEIFFQFAGHRKPVKAVLSIDEVLYSGIEVNELTDAVQESMFRSLGFALNFADKTYHEELFKRFEA